MALNDTYYWQMETSDGVITNQYDIEGKENTWKTLPLDRIVRISLIPKLNILPRHDVLIDIGKGEKFIRRFGRGFLKQKEDGIKLREYVNCIVTSNYRFWVFSNGRAMVTRPDYEVYI